MPLSKPPAAFVEEFDLWGIGVLQASHWDKAVEDGDSEASQKGYILSASGTLSVASSCVSSLTAELRQEIEWVKPGTSLTCRTKRRSWLQKCRLVEMGVMGLDLEPGNRSGLGTVDSGKPR